MADLNGDGRVDLLVGDNEQAASDGSRTEAQQERYEQLQQELSGYEDVVRALYGDSEPPAVPPTPERIQAYERLLDELGALMPDIEFHGRVWLYARPPGR